MFIHKQGESKVEFNWFKKKEKKEPVDLGVPIFNLFINFKFDESVLKLSMQNIKGYNLVKKNIGYRKGWYHVTEKGYVVAGYKDGLREIVGDMDVDQQAVAGLIKLAKIVQGEIKTCNDEVSYLHVHCKEGSYPEGADIMNIGADKDGIFLIGIKRKIRINRLIDEIQNNKE